MAGGIEYHPAQRALQDAFDTRRVADRISQRLVHHALTDANLTGSGCTAWPGCPPTTHSSARGKKRNW